MGITPSNSSNHQMDDFYRRNVLQGTELGFKVDLTASGKLLNC